MSAVSPLTVPGDSAQWSTTIGNICDQFGGDVQTGPFGSQLHAADYSDEGTPVVMPQDLQDGQIVTDRIARVAQRHALRLKQHQLKRGDIVYSRRGDVARFAVVSDTEQGWLCGTGCIRIRLNCPNLDVRYARRYLQQPSIAKWLLHNAKGVTMPNLNTAIVRALPFVYPPLPEQRRIAAILDAADTLRAKRRATIRKLDELTQSIFLDMFGDPATNPKGWPTPPLNQLFAMPPNFGTMIPPAPDGGAWLSLRVANIQNWQLDLTDRKYVDLPIAAVARHAVQNGDILLARAIASQELLGKAVVAYPNDNKWAFDSHLVRLRFDPERAEPEFIRCLLKTPGGRRLFLNVTRRSAVQFNINTREISVLRLPIAPVSLQRKFSKLVMTVDRIRCQEREGLDGLGSTFASLQHRAFRGEL